MWTLLGIIVFYVIALYAIWSTRKKFKKKITDCRTLEELSQFRNKTIDDKVSDLEFHRKCAQQFFIHLATDVKLGNMAYFCLYGPEPCQSFWRLSLKIFIVEKKLGIVINDL